MLVLVFKQLLTQHQASSGLDSSWLAGEASDAVRSAVEDVLLAQLSSPSFLPLLSAHPLLPGLVQQTAALLRDSVAQSDTQVRAATVILVLTTKGFDQKHATVGP